METNKIILSQIPIEELITAFSEVVKTEIEKFINKKPEPVTEYITRRETAHILGISLVTLNDWSRKGIIPSYHIASRVRYKKSEVLQFINNGKYKYSKHNYKH